MRVVRWLHISDLHMREAENAQRQAVLSAMLEDIRNRSTTEGQFDFLVVTGDLAFSGQRSEYELVAEFLDELAASIGLSLGRIFCVPGNHDVQRERSKMCFRGARDALKNESDVYGFLADDDERENLLLRQEDYRAFEMSFLGGRERECTEDGLGYVSIVEVDDLRIAIMELNSSWLSEGGVSDEGKLLIGESQVMNAIDRAKVHRPHVVLGLQHHPFDMLQRFDRRSVQRRMEEACHFVHCGHLHDPEVKEVVAASGRCITITAGASFESRVARNTYTIIDLDPLAGKADVVFVEYNPQVSAYEYVSKRSLNYAIDQPCDCTVAELADAIDSLCREARGISGYLAALLLRFSSDVPLMSDGRLVFANWDSADGIADSSFMNVAAQFRGVGRAVRLFYGRKSLDEILEAHGHPISAFVRQLQILSKKQPRVEEYLKMQNEAKGRSSDLEKSEPLRHTVDLIVDLVEADEWNRARDLAERTIDVSEGSSRVKVVRVLARCLARSTEESDKSRAAELYREAMESKHAEAGDLGALGALMMELKRYDEAKAVIRDGVGRFPDRAQAFVEVGMRLVQECGDRDFRDWLVAGGRGHDNE